jgi:hypothetical protein
VTVPLGAQVELTMSNEGQLPHSIQVISSRGELPGVAVVPASALAFAGAQTPHGLPGPVEGTPIQDLPTPMGPLMSVTWCVRIHSPVPGLRRSPRSNPRAW